MAAAVAADQSDHDTSQDDDIKPDDTVRNEAVQESKSSDFEDLVEPSYPTVDTTSPTSPKESEQPKNDDVDHDSAFAEFSPEAIEALAAEVASLPQIETAEDDLLEMLPELQSSSDHDQGQGSFKSWRPSAQMADRPERQFSADDRKEQNPSRSSRPSAETTDRPKRSDTTFTISYSAPLADDWVPPKRESWQVQKARLKEKFPDGWNPQKRLSPDAIAGIRTLHAQMPEQYNTSVLASHFQISPEAIRRILKSKWRPDQDTQVNREMRWFRRGERVWSRYAELGVKPPRRWRDEGIGRGKPEWKKQRTAPEESSKIVPALVTTKRREGGYFGEDMSSSITTSRRMEDETPQLVTTRRRD